MLFRSIPVKEGDTVNQGDLLVKIYPAKYELRLKKFQSSKIQSEQELSDFETVLEKRSAELDIAKKDCDRNQSMFDEKIATKEDFDRSINEMQNSNFSYLGAKKDVEDAKNKLAIILSEVEQAKIVSVILFKRIFFIEKLVKTSRFISSYKLYLPENSDF